MFGKLENFELGREMAKDVILLVKRVGQTTFQIYSSTTD